MSNLVCPLCPPDRTANLYLNISRLIKHIELFHSHEPSFRITCGIDGCLRSFHNFKVFRNHTYASHGANSARARQNSEHAVDSDHDEDSIEDSEGNTGESIITSEQLQMMSATFLMGTKEKYKLSQVALQGIIEGVTSLMQGRLSALHTQIRGIMSTSTTSMKEDVDVLFSEQHEFSYPFSGLETQHQQLKFYRNHFNFIVRV